MEGPVQVSSRFTGAEYFTDASHGTTRKIALQLFFCEEGTVSKPCRTAAGAGLRWTVKVSFEPRYWTVVFICLWKGKRIRFNGDKKWCFVMLHALFNYAFLYDWSTGMCAVCFALLCFVFPLYFIPCSLLSVYLIHSFLCLFPLKSWGIFLKCQTLASYSALLLPIQERNLHVWSSQLEN